MGMESRVDKFSSFEGGSRAARNARLYKEVYGKYDNLDNLPLEDNTDEIDMNRLQEILRSNKVDSSRKKYDDSIGVIEKKKKYDNSNRVYDINQMLEKAKNENHKLRDTLSFPHIDTSILSTLENKEVTMDDIDKPSFVKPTVDDELSMTRELKFKQLDEAVQSNPLMDHVMPDNSLSLDLFQELKPTDNTITTKPIKEKDLVKDEQITKKFFGSDGTNHVDQEVDVHSGDTSDIDIIKMNDGKENSDFFTSTYEFSDSDFLDDDRKGGILKIILLFLAIFVFAGVIAYFVIHYGLGA